MTVQEIIAVQPDYDEPPIDEPRSPLVERLEAATLTTPEVLSLPKPIPLIDGILNLDTLAVLYGPSGENKTFVALDWTLHVATGSWWHGRAVHAGPVIYIAAEGAHGLGARVDAWQHQHQIHDVDSIHPVHWLTRAVNLFDPGWTGALVEYCTARRPAMVVLDTLARNIAGAEENSAKDIGVVVAHADNVRRATGACVLSVHHTGKDLGAGARGSSALRAALDTEIECTASEARTFVRVVKQKDGPVVPPIRLERIPVRESCVLVAGSQLADDGSLSTRQQEALDVLAAIEIPGGIAAGAWFKATDLAERTFYAARRRLLDLGLVVNVGTEDRPKYLTATDSEDVQP